MHIQNATNHVIVWQKLTQRGEAAMCCVCAWPLSHVQLFMTPRTVALQALLSVGILQFKKEQQMKSRQVSAGCPFKKQRLPLRCCNGAGGLVTKSCLTLATPWTVAHQAPLSMGFSRQEYWSGLPFPSPEDLSDPGIKPGSPALQTGSLPTEIWGKPSYNGGVAQTVGLDAVSVA